MPTETTVSMAKAKASLKRYRQHQTTIRQRFIATMKAMTEDQKKEVLIEAGVLDRKGNFTDHYRTVAPLRTRRRVAAVRR